MLKCISIQLCSLVYLILLIFVFAFKQKKKKRPIISSVYLCLLLNTALVLVLDIFTNFLMFNQDKYKLILSIVGKSYLVTSIFWCLWLLIYVFLLNNNTEYENFIKAFKSEGRIRFSTYFAIIASATVCYLKSIYVFDPQKLIAYQGGLAMYATYITCFIFMGLTTIYMINNPNKVKMGVRIPIFVFLFFSLLAIVIQWKFSSVLLVSSIMAFIMLFIYFTMENPDLDIINELEHDKEEVEEASKAKTDFLSNMSHDIRTPMNAIIGFSESLLTEELLDSQKEEVQNIYEAASTLLSIINNILDVSRIESGKEEKKEGKYELRKIITQLTTMVTSKLDTNKIKFNVNIDKNVPQELIGDNLKIYQILMNLLSNAIKYTEEGHIDFTIKSDNLGDVAKLTFIVSDTGIGIKESDFDKLFVKFSRIHNQENYKSIEGTGLGLVITKQLVLLLGGTIDFKSKYGEGTTFTVVIPQIISQDLPESEIVNAINNPASVGNVHFDGSLYDVLIVDDNTLNQKVAQRILSDYKFQITCMSSGEECFEAISKGERYDLIFLDHMMPGMDGIETMHKLKELEGVKIPPVIALTANAMVGMKEMYLKEGFNGYISKPINRDELQVLLNNIFCQK